MRSEYNLALDSYEKALMIYKAKMKIRENGLFHTSC